MATITLSKGESYTFTRTGAVTTLIGSSDHAHGVMRVSNNLYMSASSNITHTIDSAAANSNIVLKAAADSNIVFKNDTGGAGQFNLGHDRDSNVFNLRTGINPFGGKDAPSTVFSVITSSNIMYVPNLHVGTNSDVGLVASGSTIFRPENIDQQYNQLSSIFPAPTGNGLLGIGWNKSGGSGEIDFISSRGAGGIDNGGGFRFYDLPKYGDQAGATYSTNGFLICSMTGPSAALPTSGSFKVEGRTQTNQLLVNTSTPYVFANVTQTATVNGQISATAFNNSSDKRLKRDILPIENALNKILMLNGVTYNWNKEFDPNLNLDDNTHIGLLAQDVEKIIPLVVHTDNSKNQIKSMTYTELIPVLIEAIKEQQTQINELKNKLKDIPYG